MKITRIPFRSHRLASVALSGLFLAVVFIPTHRVVADVESDISTTGTPSGMLEGDLRVLIESCIAANKTNPPPGNPGPFTTGYKEIIALMGQCFTGGFAGLTNLGPRVIVGAASTADAPSLTIHQLGGTPQMIWAYNLWNLIRLNTNAPLKAIMDFLAMNAPDPAGMTPLAAYSPGGDSIIMGDAMQTRTNDSFHAVLFSGIRENLGGNADARAKAVAYARALIDMKNTLQYFLHVPEANILSTNGGTYADLVQMITNTWAKMNDNEQFILFIADHGSRDNLVPPPLLRRYGNGYFANYTTEPQHLLSFVEDPRVRLKTIHVGQPGEVRLNAHTIGMLPVNGSAYYEYCFSPKLLRPLGQTNVVEVVVPGSQVELEFLGLSTGPVAGFEPVPGQSPSGAVINVRNGTGANKTDFHAVYDGRLGTNVMTHARRTQADVTPIADWATSGPTISYDWSNNVTTVSWEDLGTPIADGEYASFSVVSSNRAVRSLEYSWSPASPDPTKDLAPANIKTIDQVTMSDFRLNLVAATGLTSTQDLEVSVRYSPTPIQASLLYFGDSAITSLPSSSTQAVALASDTWEALTYSIPGGSPVDPYPQAIVESLERWQGNIPDNRVSRITQIPLLADSDTTCLTNCPGEGVFLTVNLTGGVFQWYKDGVPLAGETNGTLTLLNLSRTNRGTYSCVGTNMTEVKRKHFKLRIRDRVAPVVTGPTDVTAKATSSGGAIVNYGSIGASDSCGVLDGSTFQATPPSGSLFPIGTTEVTASVADTHGNVGMHRFYVTVLPLGADLGISANRDYVVIRWADTNALLQCTPAVTGLWANMPDAKSPYDWPFVNSQQEFFRLLLNPGTSSPAPLSRFGTTGLRRAFQ